MQENCYEKFTTMQIEMAVVNFGVITKPVYTSRKQVNSRNRQIR
jgi:hypothetical protein